MELKFTIQHSYIAKVLVIFMLDLLSSIYVTTHNSYTMSEFTAVGITVFHIHFPYPVFPRRLRSRRPAAALREGAPRKHPSPRHHLPGARPGTPCRGAHLQGPDTQGTLDLPPELPPGSLVDASPPIHHG